MKPRKVWVGFVQRGNTPEPAPDWNCNEYDGLVLMAYKTRREARTRYEDVRPMLLSPAERKATRKRASA